MLEPVTATTDGPGRDEQSPPLLPTFEQVFADQRVPLIRLAYLLTSSDEIAEDLVQDAFARLHPALSQARRSAVPAFVVSTTQPAAVSSARIVSANA
jgi:DNA-directed RNA polymerase specialized sigma24 family protein